MYFQFDGVLYLQVHGEPMSSPVSVLVSDMFMKNLEQTALGAAQSAVKPKIWKQYTNDLILPLL